MFNCIKFWWLTDIMEVQGVEFSSGGYEIRKKKCLRINMLKGNYWILRIGLVGRCLKLGISLEITVIKKIEKDLDDFWYRKLTLKVRRLGDFALFDTFPLSQFSKFNNFLWACWFLGKNLLPPVWKLHNPYCHIEY